MNVVLQAEHLRKSFYRDKNAFLAVDDVSFQIRSGECLGLVGESGCGKSTVARLVLGLLPAEGGRVRICGKDLGGLSRKETRELYSQAQMVFQSPQDSFDPRRTLGDGIMEGMRNRGRKKAEAKERLKELLELVGLPQEIAKRLPHQVSGGQCQRAAIARALSADPKLLICDEATSALDVTVQAQIVELLKRLQKEKGIALLFICHDLALVQEMCQRVLVMYEGKVIEEGGAEEVIQNPREEYTKQLLEAVF